MSKTEIRGILIDPFSKEVKEIFYQDSLNNLYKILDCQCIDIMRGIRFDMIIDDEGLLIDDEHQEFFIWNGLNEFAGRALITSTNKKGDTVSLNPAVTLEEIQGKVIFTQKLSEIQRLR